MTRALRVAPLSVPTGNTHAPGPGGLPTSYNRYLPPWPLCLVCTRKEVTNLLNRILAMRHVVARKGEGECDLIHVDTEVK